MPRAGRALRCGSLSTRGMSKSTFASKRSLSSGRRAITAPSVRGRRSGPTRHRWADLREQIEHGGYGAFYCHKGVPIGSDGEHEHPLRPDGSHDTARMRICAGFVAHRLGQAYVSMAKP